MVIRPINHFAGDRRSDTFRVFINGAEMPVMTCVNMDAQGCAELSRYYQGAHHPNMRLPARFMVYHVMHAELETPDGAEVVVRTPEPIESFGVYPLRKGIAAGADGRDLRFKAGADAPYLVIEVNALPMLCLVLERPVEAVDAGSETVDFAAVYGRFVENGVHTRAFREAVRDLNGSGRTLFIPPGVYHTESLQLHHCSNLAVHLAEGALVNMMAGPAGENRRTPGVWLHDCTGVEIRGRGCFDQRSYENFRAGRNDYRCGYSGDEHLQALHPLPPDDPVLMSPLLITDSGPVTVRDVTFRNGKVWNFSAKNSHRLRFVRCKIFTPPASNPEWTDGFNFGACRDVTIEDCFVCVNDDCFAAGHYVTPYDHGESGTFLVKGLVGYNPRAQGVRLGWACNRPQGRFLFEDCDFIGKCEIIIHPLRGAGGAVIGYEQVKFVDCGFDMFTDIGIDGATIGELEFSGVTFSRPFARGRGIIRGHPSSPIGRLTWRNTRVLGAVPRECLQVEHVTRRDTDSSWGPP